MYAERGPHGGFELLPGFQTQLMGLNHQESLALLAAGGRRGAGVFGLGSALASAMLKVFDALPNDQRTTADAAAERLLINPETDAMSHPVGSGTVPEEIMLPVRNAVLNGTKLRILYAPINRSAEWRTVDPVGLVAVHERTYLLATRLGADRTYRLSRITAAEQLETPADRSVDVDLPREWQKRGDNLLEESDVVTVVLRVSAEERRTVIAAAVHLLEERAQADGWSELTVVFRDAPYAEWVLWQLGAEAEALSPEWLRARLQSRAAFLADRYSQKI